MHVLRAIILLLLCTTAFGSVASDLNTIYATTQPAPSLSHHDAISRQLEPILLQQSRYLINHLRPWEKDSRALILTNGHSNEAGIRPNTHTAYSLAALYRTGLAPHDYRDKSIAILRFALPTHGAGNQTTNDGKQWHDQWQSALWAYDAGRAAWLLWNDLDDHMR